MSPRLLAALVLSLVALSTACTGDDQVATPSPTSTITATSSPSPTGTTATGPTPTPALAAPSWLDRTGLPVSLGVTAIGPDADAGWVLVDPETGEWAARRGLSATTPIDPAALTGRYWLVRSPDGPEGPSVEPYPLELRAAVFDSANGDVSNIGPAWAGAVSPDGTLAAVIPEVEGSTLEVVEVSGDFPRHDLGHLGKPVTLAWSPGNVLAIIRDGIVRFATAPDWTPGEAAAIEIKTESLAWSPDGSRIAFFEVDGLHVADAALSTDRRLVTVPPWSPGSGSAATAPINQRAAWSPDGNRLAFTTGTAIHIVDVESGAVTAIAPEGSASFDTSFAWSPDGERLALASNDRDHRGVVVVLADGSGAYQLTESAAFSILGWGDDGIIVYLCRCP